MNYKLLISGIYRGYNPFTNHLLTSWDIQVWYLWWCFPPSYWLFWRFSHSYQENTGPRCIAASGMGTYRWRRPTQWTCHNARSTEPRYKAMNKKGRKPVWTHTHRIHGTGTPPPKTHMLLEDDTFFVFVQGTLCYLYLRLDARSWFPLLKTNIAPENRRSPKERSIPSINFRVLC